MLVLKKSGIQNDTHMMGSLTQLGYYLVCIAFYYYFKIYETLYSVNGGVFSFILKHSDRKNLVIVETGVTIYYITAHTKT